LTACCLRSLLLLFNFCFLSFVRIAIAHINNLCTTQVRWWIFRLKTTGRWKRVTHANRFNSIQYLRGNNTASSISQASQHKRKYCGDNYFTASIRFHLANRHAASIDSIFSMRASAAHSQDTREAGYDTSLLDLYYRMQTMQFLTPVSWHQKEG
jgi:hypothetical protein